MDLPAYFDSQAQAAATLGISTYEVKAAKSAGCPAFRAGGRIRTKELVAWINENRASSNISDDDEALTVCVRADWNERRRDMLFGLLEFLDSALYQEQITAEQYCAIGDKTIPLVIKLGRVWNAEIDELGYKVNWHQLKKLARQKKS